MNVVIVAASPKVSRTYYAQQYQEGGEVVAPDCWSADGEVPDQKATTPQSKRCLDCPMNVPAYYISADMNNSMTYQNIIDGRKEFVAYSLQPFISAIENRLSMDDITRRGNQVRFALDETFLRADTLQSVLLKNLFLSLF